MPKKGENIYKRKDGRWEARYIKQRTAKGKAVYGYLYAHSYREVKSKLREQLLVLAEKNRFDSTGVEKSESALFEDAARDWLQSIAPQLKESTVNKYNNLLNLYILPSLGVVPLGQLSQEIIESQCNELLLNGGRKATGLSPKTISDILSVIRNIISFSIKAGKYAPCDARSIHVKRRQKDMRVLSMAEQERLCRYLYSDLNDGNIGILVCLFTGIRIGELCALQWEDISLSDQTIFISRTLQRIQDQSSSEKKTKVVVTSPKSACSIRTIPIPKELAEILATHKTSATGYFLTNSSQHYIEPRTMQNKFKYALKQSSISSANFHSLRHTFATRCVELGFDIKSLSEILGHATVNITMNRYVHPSLELKKENMQRLSELIAVK